MAYGLGLCNEKTDQDGIELILAKHPRLSLCAFNLKLKPECSKFTDQWQSYKDMDCRKNRKIKFCNQR